MDPNLNALLLRRSFWFKRTLLKQEEFLAEVLSQQNF